MITINCDGGCFPNPGGYVCWAYHANDEAGRCVGQNYGNLGKKPEYTVFVAEYSGLIEALKRAKAERWIGCTIRSDSQVMVNQVNGSSNVNSPHLIPLCRQAAQLQSEVKAHIIWIPREQNGRADHLCEVAHRKLLLAQPVLS